METALTANRADLWLPFGHSGLKPLLRSLDL